MAPLVSRLKVPSFDLKCWTTARSNVNFLMIPGGGGSAKTGVRNQIQIAKLESGNILCFDDGFETDIGEVSRLCSSLSIGTIDKYAVACAETDGYCTLYTLHCRDTQNVDNKLKLTRVAEFQADFSDEYATVNCSVFIQSLSMIVTGGQDGVLRTWKVAVRHGMWTVKKIKDIVGSKGPIMAIAVHPTNARWIATSSKDGYCRMWDINASQPLTKKTRKTPGQSTFSSPNPKPINESNSPNPHLLLELEMPSTGTGKPQSSIECRGCCFSFDGTCIVAVFSPRKGVSVLAKWSLSTQPVQKAKRHLQASHVMSKDVSPVPCTRLVMNDTGLLLAVGRCDGTAVVLKFEDLTVVSEVKQVVHDLPVTGLCFGPSITPMEVVVFTCSADLKLIRTVINMDSKWDVYLMAFLCLLVLIIALLIAFGSA